MLVVEADLILSHCCFACLTLGHTGVQVKVPVLIRDCWSKAVLRQAAYELEGKGKVRTVVKDYGLFPDTAKSREKVC